MNTTAAILFGMLGPLVIAAASWVLAERTWKRQPERLTSVLIGCFAAKLLFFAAYVAVMLRVAGAPPIVFVASFTISFISFHLIEALSLKRLMVR